MKAPTTVSAPGGLAPDLFRIIIASLALSRIPGPLLLVLCVIGIGTPLGEAAELPALAYHPERLLVTHRAAAIAGSTRNLHARYGARVLRSMAGGNLEVLAIPTGLGVARAASNYLASGLVDFAEPDYVRHLAQAPNDPQFVDGTLWGLHNYGQGDGKPDADIDAPEAWNLLTSASNVIVAVLDTGIRATHEDLAPNIWTNPATGGYGYDVLAGTAFPADDEGHGSLVSGIIGAAGNNGKGVVGVAWNVRLMACKCLNSQRIGYDSDIIQAIEFARTNGAKIINASMGAYAYSHALSNAIYAARQEGIIFVAACGNDARDLDVTPYYPASYQIDNIVSVAFTTRHDSLGSVSSFGATNVHLAAPGAFMYSTAFDGDDSYEGGRFLLGTSFAAPCVSGALALALARFTGEPHTRTIRRLLLGADSLPSLAGRCRTSGRLNLQNVLNPPISLSISPAFPTSVKGRTSPLRSCVLMSSEDLVHWSVVDSALSSEDGFFEVNDPQPVATARFYRAVAASEP